MKTTQALVLSIITCLFTISCNKEHSRIKTTSPRPLSIPGTSPLNTDSLAGVFYCSTALKPPSSPSTMAYAWFYDSSRQAYVDAGNFISVNADTLRNKSDGSITSNNIYYGYTDPNATTHQWYFPGNGIIPTISYNHTGPFPSYAPGLPDSIIISKGLTLNLDTSTVINTDSIELFIYAPSGTLKKTFAASAGMVTIMPSELSPLYADSLLPIQSTTQLYAHTYTIQTFAGKQFGFYKESMIQKDVFIKK